MQAGAVVFRRTLSGGPGRALQWHIECVEAPIADSLWGNTFSQGENR